MYAKAHSTTSNTPITTTTSTVTTTATAGDSSSTSLACVSAPARTLEHGFGKVSKESGRLDSSFLFVLGYSQYDSNQSVIASIIADVGYAHFSEYTERSVFDDLKHALEARIQEPNWTGQLSDLKASLISARGADVEGQRCDVLLRLVETLSTLSTLLILGQSVGTLRKTVTKVVGGLYRDLWPEHEEPQLSAKDTGAKKKAKAKKASEKESSSNSSKTAKGGSIARKLKRLSMKFTAVDKSITPQQLLAQEEGKLHGDDWAESSQWWVAQGWKIEDAAVNSSHESFGS